jgi:hypothetical protein
MQWEKIGGPGYDFVCAENNDLYGISPDQSAIYKYNPASTSPPSSVVQQVLRFYIGSSECYVNDQLQMMDAAPIIENGRTLLPIRYVATPLGATVDWDPVQDMITVILDSKTIQLWINQNTANVNGATVMIDPGNPDVTPIVVPPGRTMLPLRFVSEQLGCQVDWDPAQQMVTVTYPKP